MDYQTLKLLASDLGFTPDKIVPLLVLALLFIFLVNRRVSPIEKLAKRLEEFIIRFCGALETGGDIRNVKSYSQSSPLNITPEGLETIKKIGFTTAIDNNLEVLFRIIDRLKPKSALDVETTSIGLIRYLMTEKEVNIFKEVEDFLYKNPEYNNSEYFKTAGLYLRDKYLEKHQELLPK